MQQIVEFLRNEPCEIIHATDASACIGIIKRKGAGKLKHLIVRQLWLQDVSRRPDVQTRKIARCDNPADALCSLPTVTALSDHMAAMNFDTTCWPRGEKTEQWRGS